MGEKDGAWKQDSALQDRLIQHSPNISSNWEEGDDARGEASSQSAFAVSYTESSPPSDGSASRSVGIREREARTKKITLSDTGVKLFLLL